ncbi:DUF1028 domain-containing protein [Patiriisocius sp. Uisw_017]|jgi:uncharacterized Ntn-hydrolase superfamily protein|uniref:DUF1028 domain-containing protein n=1 Tax=Patiriisocius sp. Uisw_017 TaxID=3230968 RepID=UPI0039EA5B89
MIKKLYAFLGTVLLTFAVQAQDTFSIIAVDPANGDIGSAGASCVDGAANFGGIIDIITRIIPGRGGVNSQAYVCIPNSNLNNAIAQMEMGSNPSEIIDFLIANDACNSQNFDPAFRQYGIADFDTDGNPRVAGFTGASADDFKDDIQGTNFSVQGNILLNETVLNNMQVNFTNTSGTLADKLMAAMQGANFAGADSRCLARGTSSTSAYLLVYKQGDDVNDPHIRLNIEEMPFGEEPIDSLQILYNQFLGVDDNALKNAIKMYPNPVDDVLTISLSQIPLLKRLEVLDLQGKALQTTEDIVVSSGAVTIDTAHLTSGMYFIRITTLGGTATVKFLKK